MWCVISTLDISGGARHERRRQPILDFKSLGNAEKCLWALQQPHPFVSGGKAYEKMSEPLQPPFPQSGYRAMVVVRDPAVFQEPPLIAFQRVRLCDPSETAQVIQGLYICRMPSRAVVRLVTNAGAKRSTADIIGREHLIEVGDTAQPIEP